MKAKSVRTRVDLPPDLHRQLCEAAAGQGRTVQHFIVAAIKQAISSPPPKRRLLLDRPLLAGKRKPITITNEEIYKLGFP